MIPPLAIENEIATAAWLFEMWVVCAGPLAVTFCIVVWKWRL